MKFKQFIVETDNSVRTGTITAILQEPYKLGHITFVWVLDDRGITHKLDKQFQLPKNLTVGDTVRLVYHQFMWRIE